MALLVSGLAFFGVTAQSSTGLRESDPPPTAGAQWQAGSDLMSDRGNATTASNCIRDHGPTMIARSPLANATANAVLLNTAGREDRGRDMPMDRYQGPATEIASGDVLVRRLFSGDDFCRGDEAYSCRVRLPNGRLDCASRFRFDPSYSLLIMVRLGRNLITLFSTVNTLRAKKSRWARATGAIGRSRKRQAGATRDDCACIESLRSKTKNAFFQRFHLSA